MARWPLQTEIQIVRGLLRILGARERRRLLFLIPPILLVAFLEVLGIASLAPFIALLAQPDRFMKHRVLRWAYTTLEFTSTDSLFFFIGSCILLLLIVSNATAATTQWAMLRFAWGRSASLSSRLLGGYLHRPYAFFLERNVGELLRKAFSEAQILSVDVLWHVMALLARAFAICLIAGTLFFIEPVLATGAIVIFGGIYGTIFAFSRRRAARAGRTRTGADLRRFRVAAEAMTGVKEVKLYRLEDSVLAHYRRDSILSTSSAANHAILSQMPRYALETIAFGGVLVMMLYLLKTRHGLGGALPILGIYAFASMRLLPALQAIFVGFNALRYNSGIVSSLEKEFAAAPLPQKDTRAEPIAFDQSVHLDDICFSYARSPRPVLDHVSFTLKRGEWVGFVGPTGSGKSTLVDILLGLLQPTSGTLSIDGVSLTEHRQLSWQAQTAYVPQQIFLVDDTVEANICFGVPPDSIDRQKLEWAARVAQIHDFVAHEMPDGYKSTVGDRGVRLSGGQRQRIGIARALYRQPRFLVLDEATSALDGATETAFFQALHEHLRDVTVVSVTHRLTTTLNFDRVYRMEQGTIVGEVRPEELTAADNAEQPAQSGGTA
jgi:ABC-type multidrug transport system fused ATPase/permease subunit